MSDGPSPPRRSDTACQNNILHLPRGGVRDCFSGGSDPHRRPLHAVHERRRQHSYGSATGSTGRGQLSLLCTERRLRVCPDQRHTVLGINPLIINNDRTVNPSTPTVAIRVKHVPDRVKQSFVIFDTRALWRSALTLSPERQSARMSKITNDGLTQSGTGCFIAVYPCGNSGRQRVKAGTHGYGATGFWFLPSSLNWQTIFGNSNHVHAHFRVGKYVQ